MKEIEFKDRNKYDVDPRVHSRKSHKALFLYESSCVDT